jgi:hypothetical protein
MEGGDGVVAKLDAELDFAWDTLGNVRKGGGGGRDFVGRVVVEAKLDDLSVLCTDEEEVACVK